MGSLDIQVVDPGLGLLQVKRGPAEPGFQRLLHHEHRILQRLQGLEGCPCLVRFDPEVPELVTAAAAGLPLGRSGLPGRLDLSRFLQLAGALARLVAAFHGRGVIHRNLNPETLLVRLPDLSVEVTRFERATTFGSEPAAEPLSSLAYASPEQTGRMNRPVDARSDLYSLGATLYQLAAGRPPFEDPSPLGLVHAHLARVPRSPEELVPWMPPKVSEVLLALLAKEPDERYQSASGLARDLEALRRALASRSPLAGVALRQHDLPPAPRPAVRLRGRERELSRLEGAVERAARGESAALFVAGSAGLGKTKLCREVSRLAALRQGLLVRGKFEQISGDRPFRAPAQALAQLCEMLLAHPPEDPAEWREAMAGVLGPDAGALSEVLPDLEALLGPQEPPARLGPDEERVRLRHLAVRFLKGLASSLRPLCSSSTISSGRTGPPWTSWAPSWRSRSFQASWCSAPSGTPRPPPRWGGSWPGRRRRERSPRSWSWTASPPSTSAPWWGISCSWNPGRPAGSARCSTRRPAAIPSLPSSWCTPCTARGSWFRTPSAASGPGTPRPSRTGS